MSLTTCTIIIPTHSNYLDVCENFISVLRKSWEDCPYQIVVSICGKNCEFTMAETSYNGEKATLLDCVVDAAKAYPSEQYMIFLGDAFMCGRVDTEKVEKLLFDLRENEIAYCALRPIKTLFRKRQVSRMFRQIHIRDRYNHSFICFAASPEFIFSEFSNPAVRTDFDFEVKYLQLVNEAKQNIYFEKHAILTEDIFHIRPGIEKGMWDRRVLSWLQKNYPSIEYAKRKKLGKRHQIYSDILRVMLPRIPNSLRKLVKQTAKVFVKDGLFYTDT